MFKKIMQISNVFILVMIQAALAQAQPPQPGVPSFDDGKIPEFVITHNTEIELVDYQGKAALQVIYDSKVEWPNVFFRAGDSPWDWRDYSGIAIDMYNPGDESVSVNLRVDNEGANGTDNCNVTQKLVPAGQSKTLKLYFSTKDREIFWGMRGIPVRGPMGNGSPLDMSKITAWQLYLARPQSPHTILITSVTLFGEGGDLTDKVPFPFIDAYGQYIHTDWPGKIKKDKDFQIQHKKELAQRAAHKTSHLDAYGGWKDGPKLEATGWFRTTKIKDQQWLVTPEGHLFFSLGVDCVGTWSQTFIEGRKTWFSGMPDENDPKFKSAFGYVGSTHSMAENIGGKGKTYSFYSSNLIRKFGEDWRKQWIDNSLARLKDWGFNTIGNWSQGDLLSVSDIPFVVNMNLSGVRPIESSTGYWAKMMDVYDPSFTEAVEKTIANRTKQWRDNRYCLGYFVDNELAWSGVMDGVLTSNTDQPVRQAFIKELQGKYKTLSKLNEAWKTSYAKWSDIGKVNNPAAAVTKDLEDFHFTFAERYYRIIKQAFERHAPNQLYLGSRFSGAPDPVVRACAVHADVVSFNIYQTALNQSKWGDISKLNKPIMIGEFHFGATDRGMFHTGLVPVETQADRGKAYEHYVKSVMDNPAFVGCHWFQYVDEPTTGRTHDGENYNIGFVDVTDTPYPHMVESAKKIHGDLYARRFKK